MPRRLPNLKTTLQRFRRKRPKEIEEQEMWFSQIIHNEITKLSEFIERNYTKDKTRDETYYDYWKDQLTYEMKKPIAFDQSITRSNLVRAVKHDLIEYFLYYYYVFIWEEDLVSKDEKDFIREELHKRLDLYKHIAGRYLDVYNQVTTGRELYNDIEFNRYVNLIKRNMSASHKKYVKDFDNLNLYFSIVQAVEIVLNYINGNNKNIDLLSYWNRLQPRDPDLEINIIQKDSSTELRPLKTYTPPSIYNDNFNFDEIRPTPSRNPLNSPPPQKNRRFLGKKKNNKKELPKTFFMEENEDYLAKVKEKWTLKKRDLNAFRTKLGEHVGSLIRSKYGENFDSYQDNYMIHDDEYTFGVSIQLENIDTKQKFIDEITNYFLVITEYVYTYNHLPHVDEEEQKIDYINLITKQLYFLCIIALNLNNTSNVTKPIQIKKSHIIIHFMEDMIAVSYKTAFADMLKEFYDSYKIVTGLKQWIPIIFHLDIRSNDEIFQRYDRNLASNIGRVETNLILIKDAYRKSNRVYKNDDDDDDVPF